MHAAWEMHGTYVLVPKLGKCSSRAGVWIWTIVVASPSRMEGRTRCVKLPRASCVAKTFKIEFTFSLNV